jgi:hypothetical protein
VGWLDDSLRRFRLGCRDVAVEKREERSEEGMTGRRLPGRHNYGFHNFAIQASTFYL